MGRDYTGALRNTEMKRLEMSYLLKLGLTDKAKGNTVLKWTNGSSIGFYCDTTGEVPFIRLKYTITDACTNEKIEMDYRINMYRKKSNLGKGVRFYFICPEAYKGATILYMGYGSYTFKCRDAYRNRIYYEDQILSKKWREIETSHLYRKIEELSKCRNYPTYKGQPTKRELRIKAIEDEIYCRENGAKFLLSLERFIMSQYSKGKIAT